MISGGGGWCTGRPLRRACLPCLPWCGRAGGVAGCTCARWVVHLWGRMISGGVVCTGGAPAVYLPCRGACHGDGVPEAVAGHACAVVAGYACAWVVHLRAHDLRRRGTPAAPAVCLPALLVMVTACRWWWRGVLARRWCTCGGPCGVLAPPWGLPW
ncbi:MAG: hypothetical protein MSQ05_01315 [Akkermansia sp.]|nr:hypothetical protein [Akkermansia sp.]